MPATKPTTPKAYLDSLPEDRRKAIRKIRAVINKNLPKGYKEGMQYGMIGWFVPHSVYPDGYHCDPKQPVPFASVASQKNYISIYLMCIYGSKSHRAWFDKAWAASGKKKPNMGKSCIRIKDIDDVPLDVIGEAIARVPADEYIKAYEKLIPASKRKKK